MAAEPRFDGCEVAQQLRAGPATQWYLGQQMALGRRVVIKSLRPEVPADSAFAAPLEQEAQFLARLQHRNIVQLYEFQKRPQQMWLVLEYVDGWTLEELLAQLGRLSVPAALAIAEEVAAALSYVHEHGIVHRDVRPGNILVSRQGEVKLANFFFSAAQGTLPPPELLDGDAGFADASYMSPEQLLGEPTDSRSDLFSLGVVLYEMVSGKRPFDGPDSRTTSQRIRHEPPGPLDAEVSSAAPLLERLLLRALEKLPSDRFADAAELCALLERAQPPRRGSKPQERIVQELAKGGLIDAEVSLPAVLTQETQPRLLLSAFKVYTGCLLLLLGGGHLISVLLDNTESERPSRVAELPFAPKDAATLHAVVRPWAHVFVNGQKVATTPFAHPIPLGPGTYYVRFDHPSSESVERRLQVTPGQDIFLEIDMPLPNPEAELTDEDRIRIPARPDAGKSP